MTPEVSKIKAHYEKDLAVAMLAYEASIKALHVLSKKHIQELKSFSSPPPAVALPLNGVLSAHEQLPPTGEDEKPTDKLAGVLSALMQIQSERELFCLSVNMLSSAYHIQCCTDDM